jgi:hypothetical protein
MIYADEVNVSLAANLNSCVAYRMLVYVQQLLMKEKRERCLNDSQIYFLANKPLNPGKGREDIVHYRPEEAVVNMVANSGC